MKKILIIDDDPIVGVLLKSHINRIYNDALVDTTENGKEALYYIEQITKTKTEPFPDFIFLDINMPIMNGFDFLDQLESGVYANIKNTPLVVLSSSVDPADIDKAKNYSMVNEFCSKPLLLNDLKSLFQKYIN
jgi:CheY-like chemotaxis protein